MRATIHLQNIVDSGCVSNVRFALELIDGVKAVQVDRDRKVAEVLYSAPATALDLRQQLLTMGYLAEGRASE
jgi:copper chaperone CopZ